MNEKFYWSYNEVRFESKKCRLSPYNSHKNAIKLLRCSHIKCRPPTEANDQRPKNPSLLHLFSKSGTKKNHIITCILYEKN